MGKRVVGVALFLACLGILSMRGVAGPSTTGIPLEILKFDSRSQVGFWVMPSTLSAEDPGPVRGRARVIPPEPLLGRRLPDRFVYGVTLQNVGSATVNQVRWEYVITDPDSNKELARLRFETPTKIEPGKSARLQAFTGRPPTTTVSVNALKKGYKAIESVQVVSVRYLDGSIWATPEASRR
jgi:hypothetical protein